MMTPPSALRTVLYAVAGFLTLSASLLPGQSPTRRLFNVPSGSEAQVALRDSVTEHPKHSQLLGSLPGDTAITSMALILKPTDAQNAALTQLLTDQQNASSASYHQWLTPSAYGAMFGAADGDIAVLQSWLQARGFTVESVAASRNRIVFSGTASAVENAFGVQMQRYSRNGRPFFENSGNVELPASLATVVQGVSGLSSYRLPAPQSKRALTAQLTASPEYTTSAGKHYLVPWDFRQIFGLNTLIGSGYDGTGIKIGIIGQSAVDTTQLTYFQQKTGQTVKLPTMVLVPNTGASAKVSGDEAESELDLEYASGSAPGASVQFIYTGCANAATGNCGNNGVFDAISYAITNNLAPVLSLSYGGCEAEDASYAISTLEPVLRQANLQGQTILVSSGDTGAAGCETSSSPKSATTGLAVSYPASSPYVTGVGGTQLSSDSTTYWSATNNSYLGSALGYVPEVAWNDTALYGSLTASGGGASKIFGKPSWQTGTGVPADGHRDVPDVAFPANVSEHAYMICDADDTCTSGSNGFTTGKDGGGVGGTSASAPNFAAMLAILEQANGGSALGNINAALYTLASGSSATSVFHDITSGSNVVPCTVGTVDCTTGTLGYSATTGYDLVTGLGSIMAPGLLAGLQAAAPTLKTPTISLITSNTTPLINVASTFTVTVGGSGATPTGVVTISVDGTPAGTVTLSSGSGIYSLSSGFATAGNHTVLATYTGDSNFAAASASLTVTASTGTGSLTLSSSPTTLTITAGGTGTEAIAITSVSGFTGALSFKASLTSSSTSTFPYCLSITPVTLAANATQTATLTVNTASTCTSTGGLPVASSLVPASRPGGSSAPLLPRGALVVLSAGLAGGLLFRRRLRPLALFAAAGSVLLFGISGCGSGGNVSSTSGSTSTTTTTTNSTSVTGTYGLRVTAISSTYATVSANTTFTLVVK